MPRFGKTAQMYARLTEWLWENPGKKALIVKPDENVTVSYDPPKQLASRQLQGHGHRSRGGEEMSARERLRDEAVQKIIDSQHLSNPIYPQDDGGVLTSNKKVWASLRESFDAGWQAREAECEALRWISVNEKLPNPCEEVLGVVLRHAWSNSGKTIKPADSWVQIVSIRPDKIWIDDESTFGTRDEREAAKYHKSEWREVTHWMEMPQPPRRASVNSRDTQEEEK